MVKLGLCSSSAARVSRPRPTGTTSPPWCGRASPPPFDRSSFIRRYRESPIVSNRCWLPPSTAGIQACSSKSTPHTGISRQHSASCRVRCSKASCANCGISRTRRREGSNSATASAQGSWPWANCWQRRSGRRSSMPREFPPHGQMRAKCCAPTRDPGPPSRQACCRRLAISRRTRRCKARGSHSAGLSSRKVSSRPTPPAKRYCWAAADRIPRAPILRPN